MVPLSISQANTKEKEIEMLCYKLKELKEKLTNKTQEIEALSQNNQSLQSTIENTTAQKNILSERKNILKQSLEKKSLNSSSSFSSLEEFNQKIKNLEKLLHESIQKNETFKYIKENLQEKRNTLNIQLQKSLDEESSLKKELEQLKENSNVISMHEVLTDQLPISELLNDYTFKAYFNNHEYFVIELLIWLVSSLPEWETRTQQALEERIKINTEHLKNLKKKINNKVISIDKKIYESFKGLYTNYSDLCKQYDNINTAFFTRDCNFLTLINNFFDALDSVFITTENTQKKKIHITWDSPNTILTKSPEVNSLLQTKFLCEKKNALNSVALYALKTLEKQNTNQYIYIDGYPIRNAVPLQKFIESIIQCQQ
jgi:chromosome segregation ATPase